MVYNRCVFALERDCVSFTNFLHVLVALVCFVLMEETAFVFAIIPSRAALAQDGVLFVIDIWHTHLLARASCT